MHPADEFEAFAALIDKGESAAQVAERSGCGTLPFCGTNHLQLIVSQRHPALVAGESGGQNTGWGFTLIRRRDPAHGRRSSSYEFLAPGGQVAWFEADQLPVRPSREQAYQQPLQWGTLIKL
jgi:hypothetical protein